MSRVQRFVAGCDFCGEDVWLVGPHEVLSLSLVARLSNLNLLVTAIHRSQCRKESPANNNNKVLLGDFEDLIEDAVLAEELGDVRAVCDLASRMEDLAHLIQIDRELGSV